MNNYSYSTIAYGVCGSLLEWIGNFLTDRTQQTRVGQFMSKISVIISGVIQGSCLGPVLFLLYVNDLIDVLSDDVIVKMYAGDVKLYTNCMLSINDIESFGQVGHVDGHMNGNFQSHTRNVMCWR